MGKLMHTCVFWDRTKKDILSPSQKHYVGSHLIQPLSVSCFALLCFSVCFLHVMSGQGLLSILHSYIHTITPVILDRGRWRLKDLKMWCNNVYLLIYTLPAYLGECTQDMFFSWEGLAMRGGQQCPRQCLSDGA